jgi:DNA-directed RNA polymerase subunit beta
VAGTIVDVRVFNRHGIEIDDRTRAIQNEEIERLAKDREDERAILNRATYNRLKDMLLGQVAAATPKGLKKGVDITEELLGEVERHEWWKFAVADDARQQQLEATKAQYDATIKSIVEKFEDRKEKLERGDELAPGVLKMVKVFVAVKRKLQPGDKMAGRHGNKGIISRILPQEDMPFLEDGTPVDFVLNPLGVPSRMNVGQIFETHLGWAARGLGRKIGDALDAWREANPNPEVGQPPRRCASFWPTSMARTTPLSWPIAAMTRSSNWRRTSARVCRWVRRCSTALWKPTCRPCCARRVWMSRVR